MTAPKLAEYIESTPGVCGGKPRIKGSRITVQNVAIWHEQGRMAPEEIAARYPWITLEGVRAALAYYHANREEIEASIQKDEQLIRELEASQPSLIERLRNREHAKKHPVPPG